MSRILSRTVGLFLLLSFGAWAYGQWKNPEKVDLDDAARAGAPGRFVTLSAGVTHYDVAGPDAGRTVVLVPSYSLPYYVWDTTTEALTAAGYRVVRYDHYGRGFSDRPDVAYDSALYDTQIVELLDSLGVTEPVDMMGVSFGGFVIANFVTNHPKRVRTLTFVDPQAEPTPLSLSLRLPVIGPWLWQVRDVPDMAAGQLGDFVRPEEAPPGWVERYLFQMRYRGFGRALLRTDATTAATDFSELYAGVGKTGVPVLLIWGQQDPVVPIKLAPIVRDGIPGIRFEPIDSAGHVPIVDRPSTVNALILDFLYAHWDEKR